MFRSLHTIEKKISRTFSNKSKSSQISSRKSEPIDALNQSQEDEEQVAMMTEEGADQGRGTPARVSIDDHEAQQKIFDSHYHHFQESVGTESIDTPRQTRALTDRYQKALGEGESGIYRNGSPPQSSRHKQVGLGGDSSSSSDDGSEFDWDKSDESGMDEAEREERKKEKAREHSDSNELEHHIRRAKRLRKVYLSFMRLSRPIRTTLLLLLGSGIAILPTIVVCYRFPQSPAKPHVLVWSIWAAINVAASCATSIIVDFLPAVVIKVFYFLYGSTPEKLKTQVELWQSVKLWIKLALSFTWYWVILLVMFMPNFPFHDNPKLSYFSWFKKFAGALFGTAVVLLVEKILLQMIKINFHRTSLKDRLEENEKALWALDKLAAAKNTSHTPKRRTAAFLSNFAHGRRSQDGSGRNTPGRRTGQNTPASIPTKLDNAVIDVPETPASSYAEGHNSLAHKLEKKLKIEAQKKRKHRSGNITQVTDQLTAAIANVTMKDNRRSAAALGSTHSAKKLARKLFDGLDEDRGGVLTRNEFEPFFKNAADAAEAFKLFDKDGNGDIDKKEMRSAVSRIYRERRALATSLRDMSSAVAKLDAVLVAMAVLISIFIWLLVFNPKGTTDQLVPIATVILGFSFVFGNAAKNLFESMLFIFSVHPYDVGDLVFIDDSPMFVLEFGLFSTTFQRVDGQVIVAPNSVLVSQKYILNVRRSGAMWETTNVMVNFDTPLEVLQEFRTKLRQYVADNPREWKGGLDVNIDFMKNQNLIQLIIAMEHKGNWQDWGARWDRRSLLMKEIKKIMDSLNITYKLPIQPISITPRRPGAKPLGGSGNSSFRQTRGESDSVVSPISRAGNNRFGNSSSSNLLGNAARLGTNAEQNWNVGGIPNLRVQTNRS